MPPTPPPPGDTSKILTQDALVAIGGDAAQLLPTTLTMRALPKSAQCTITDDFSEFEADWFATGKAGKGGTSLPQFERLLRLHDGDLTFMDTVRAYVLDAADKELSGSSTTNFLSAISELYRKAMGAERTIKDFGSNHSSLLDAMENGIGGPHAYDPWNGWWAGGFDNEATPDPKNPKFFNLHVWDPAVDVGIRRVQAVTQIEVKNKSRWFGSADLIANKPGNANMFDHAINVVDSVGKVTGYVHKNLGGASEERLPHVGFLIQPDVLVWVAPVLKLGKPEKAKRDDTQEAKKNKAFAVVIFVETGFAKSDQSGRYGIRGGIGYFNLFEDNSVELFSNIEQIGQHKGDYKAVIHVADRASLVCAKSKGVLDGMDLKTVDDILKYVT